MCPPRLKPAWLEIFSKLSASKAKFNFLNSIFETEKSINSQFLTFEMFACFTQAFKLYHKKIKKSIVIAQKRKSLAKTRLVRCGIELLAIYIWPALGSR